MSEAIDPTVIMARHRSDEDGYCLWCDGEIDAPCEPYQLAEALAAERAKLARVEALATRLAADGYSTSIYESAAEFGEIIRAELADQRVSTQ